jgi:hypothetical protein
MFTKATTTLLLFLVATTASAQSEPDVISLRAETERLEQNMYTLFNELNSNDELDVACDRKGVTGSAIPVWQCEAAFMRNARTRDVGNRWDNQVGGGNDSFFGNSLSGNAPQTAEQLAFKYRRKTRQLNDEMKELALQHPELAAAMLALNDARQRLAAAK